MTIFHCLGEAVALMEFVLVVSPFFPVSGAPSGSDFGHLGEKFIEELMKKYLELTDENNERTLIFVDMLGFANLTKENPFRVVDVPADPSDPLGICGSSTSALQTNITLFYRILGMCISDGPFLEKVNAMIFSDCAFLDADNSIAAGILAKNIMRRCIQNKIPVRIGLGRGTFYHLFSSVSIVGSSRILNSRFVGTAVVFSHEAESCGGKGMRIFLHPTVVEDLRQVPGSLRVVPLKKAFPNAAFELNYLYTAGEQIGPTDSIQHLNRQLSVSVDAMKSAAPPNPKIRRQYTATLAALKTMKGR